MSKYRVLILYDVPGWAYWQRATALKKYAPDDFEVTLASLCKGPVHKSLFDNADLVFLLDYTYASQFKQRLGDMPLVVSFNMGPDRRQRHQDKIAEVADWAIFNNSATYERWPKILNRCCIPNGVDLDIFKPTVPFEERPNRALWMGSKTKDVKGYKEVIEPLGKRLANYGVELDVIHGTGSGGHLDMPAWYNSGRYILCASKEDYEGTPNTITEGVACGCVAVSTRTGNILDWGKEGPIPRNCCLVYRDMGSFWVTLRDLQIVRLSGMDKWIARNGLATIQQWGYNTRAAYFFALWRKLIDREPVEPFRWDKIEPECI